MILDVVRSCTAIEVLHLNVSDADNNQLASAILALPRLRTLVLRGNTQRNPTYHLPSLVDIVVAHIDKYDTLEEVELRGIQSDADMHRVLSDLTARERKPRLKKLEIKDREPRESMPKVKYLPPVYWSR